MKLAVALLTISLLGLAADRAESQTLVKDIHTGTAEDWGSYPDHFVTRGATTFFAATRQPPNPFAITREVLWRTDGTAPGTVPLMDFRRGADIRELVLIGSTLFAVVDQTEGDGIWVSDGTGPGTQQIAAFEQIGDTAVWGGLLCFAATTPALGSELWRTDGTPAGTIPVEDIRGGAAGSDPHDLVAFGARLMFAANDGRNGDELWVSRGSAASTFMLADIGPDSVSSNPEQLTAAGAWVFFVAYHPVVGAELFVSDGTAGGTTIASDIRRGHLGSAITGLTANGTSGVVFSANDGTHGQEPWVSNAGGVGTQIMEDVNLGTASSFPRQFIVDSGFTIYFTADDGVVGEELWGGDSSGASLLVDISVGPGSPRSRLLFLDASSTSASADLLLNSEGYMYRWVSATGDLAVLRGDWLAGVPVGGYMLLSAKEFYGDDYELWRSDRTVAGTFEIMELAPPGPSGSDPSSLMSLDDGRLFFTAEDEHQGREIWTSDGTSTGTRRFVDIFAGPGDGVRSELFKVGGMMFFAGDDDLRGNEPWVSDGTLVGTRMLRNIQSGPADSIPRFVGQLGGEAYFMTGPPLVPTALWRSDGTAGGTRKVFDIGAPGMPVQLPILPKSMAELRGELYFVGRDAVNGWELWRTDGTSAGTAIVFGLGGATGGVTQETEVVRYRNRLYFAAKTSGNNVEPYATDGTSAGTFRLKDIHSGPPGSSPNSFIVAHERLYFVATSTSGTELWRSDGTGAGTQLVHDLSPGAQSSSPSGLVGADGVLYFTAFEPSRGRELYRVTGPTALPSLVQDLNPGPASSGERLLKIAQLGSSDRVIFAAAQGNSGLEVYQSNGASISRVANVALPDPWGSNPGDFTRIGVTLYFTARTPGEGRELHKLGLAAAGGVLAEPIGDALPGGTGEARIRAIGYPTLGDPEFALSLHGAPPKTHAWLVASHKRADIEPFNGCVLYPSPDTALFLETDLQGNASVPIAIPKDPVLIGVQLFAQFAILDPKGCYLNLLSFSDGMHLMVNH